MNKGLEALKHLYAKLSCKSTIEEIDENLQEYDIIEKELKRLEWYDNLGKPTSGILPKKQDYRLNQLLNGFEYIDQEDIRSLCQKRYEEIIDIIDENETNKKVLEIIKEALDNHGCAVIQYGFIDIKGSIYDDEKVKLLKEVLYD